MDSAVGRALWAVRERRGNGSGGSGGDGTMRGGPAATTTLTDAAVATGVTLLVGPRESGKTSLAFQLAYATAAQDAQRVVLFLCVRARMNAHLPLAARGEPFEPEVLARIKLRYLDDLSDLTAYCARLPSQDARRLPHLLVVDDLSALLPADASANVAASTTTAATLGGAHVPSSSSSSARRTAQLAHAAALLHDTLVHVRRRRPECVALVTDTVDVRSLRALFELAAASASAASSTSSSSSSSSSAFALATTATNHSSGAGTAFTSSTASPLPAAAATVLALEPWLPHCVALLPATLWTQRGSAATFADEPPESSSYGVATLPPRRLHAVVPAPRSAATALSLTAGMLPVLAEAALAPLFAELRLGPAGSAGGAVTVPPRLDAQYALLQDQLVWKRLAPPAV